MDPGDLASGASEFSLDRGRNRGFVTDQSDPAGLGRLIGRETHNRISSQLTGRSP
jgi:hypothetical protein